MWNLLKLCMCIFMIIFSIILVRCEETSGNAKEKLIDSSQGNKHVLKRYDQEYQTCLESFDIHKDKIIRTQDSREMGAKYINEFDLGSREECLRACCGTESCDVFVFEEKSPGSCYLFHCGPADDFKCKFTKHHNYTSAVLAPARHLNELENQIKLTKHEQELTQLRKPDVTAQSTGTPFASTTIIVPEPPKETIQLVPISTNTSTPNRRCSVYQFECRSSGECIAIYNACDGIPQCADGSDEAPELDCPPQGTTQPPAPALPLRPSTPPQTIPKVVPPMVEPPLQRKYNVLQEQQPQQQQQHASQPPEGQQMGAGYNNGGQMFRQQIPPQGWQQPPQQLPQPQPQAPVMPQYPAQHEVNNAVIPMTSNMQLQGKMYSMEGESQTNYNNMPWNNYQHMPAGQYPGTGNHQYEEGNSHIFNHKGNSLVLDSDSSNGQYSENRNEYNAKYVGNNAGNNMYYNNGPYRPPVPPNMWQTNQQSQTHDMNSMPSQGEGPHPESERKMPLPPDYYYEDGQGIAAPDPRFRGLGMHEHDHDHEHEHEPGMRHQDVRPYPYHQPQKSGAQTAPSPDKMGQKPEPSLELKLKQDLTSVPYKNKGTIDVQVKPEKPRHHNNELTTPENQPKDGSVKKRVKGDAPVKEHLLDDSVVIEELDGQAGRPTGAILSLALGLCITGLLITLVGCRVRVIRKRLRRGSKTYAHDADYLVNGMYL